MIKSGFLLVDKAENQTSMDVVRIIRRVLGVPKVGHLGTLDPFASGLLPILIGGATRLSEYVIEGKKGYRFCITLGTETDTLDSAGKVIKEASLPGNPEEKAQAVIEDFLGVIEQIPPVYSAIKMNGMALYEHMRGSGALPFDIETKKRNVQIYSLKYLGIETEPIENICKIFFEVTCSKGTYIRSLARDIAYKMGTVGHCSALRREFVEPWTCEEAIVVDKQKALSKDVVLGALRPVDSLCPEFPSLVLGEDLEKVLASGNQFVCLNTKEFAITSDTLGFVTAGEVKFLADIQIQNSSELFIQPRKRIY